MILVIYLSILKYMYFELLIIGSFFLKTVKVAMKAYFFSLLPAPVSLKPLAKGLWSIFSCVIWN